MQKQGLREREKSLQSVLSLWAGSRWLPECDAERTARRDSIHGNPQNRGVSAGNTPRE